MPYFVISNLEGNREIKEFPNDDITSGGFTTSSEASGVSGTIPIQGVYGSYFTDQETPYLVLSSFNGYTSEYNAYSSIDYWTDSAARAVDDPPSREYDKYAGFGKIGHRKHYWTPQSGAIQPGVNPKNQWRQRKLSNKRKGQNQTINATHNPTALLTPALATAIAGSTRPKAVPDLNGFGNPTGWTIDTNTWLEETLTSTGDSTASGYGENVICRVDEIPEFTVDSSSFQLGVVAFHYEGIRGVLVECDGPSTACWITSATHNTRTDVYEWTCILDNRLWFNTTNAENKLHELRITAYPDNGIPRRQVIKFWVDKGTLTANDPVVYCSTSGNDITGDGTSDNTFRHIPRALTELYFTLPSNDSGWNRSTESGGKVILKDAGNYIYNGAPGYIRHMPATDTKPAYDVWKNFKLKNDRWIIIAGADGVTPKDINLCSAWGWNTPTVSSIQFHATGTPVDNGLYNDASTVGVPGLFASAVASGLDHGWGRAVPEKYISQVGGTSSFISSIGGMGDLSCMPFQSMNANELSKTGLQFVNSSGYELQLYVSSLDDQGNTDWYGDDDALDDIIPWTSNQSFKRLYLSGISFNYDRINSIVIPNDMGLVLENCEFGFYENGLSGYGQTAVEHHPGFGSVSGFPSCHEGASDLRGITPMLDPYNTCGTAAIYDYDKYPGHGHYSWRKAGRDVTWNNCGADGNTVNYTYFGSSGTPGNNYNDGSGILGGTWGYHSKSCAYKTWDIYEDRDFHCFLNCSSYDIGAYNNSNFIRNCLVSGITGDIVRNNQCVINLVADDVQGNLGEHTDCWQFFAGAGDYDSMPTNLIYYGMKVNNYRSQLMIAHVTGARATHPHTEEIVQYSKWDDNPWVNASALYIDANSVEADGGNPVIFENFPMRDIAFVNCALVWDMVFGDPSQSMMKMRMDHVLWDNCTIIGASGTHPGSYLDSFVPKKTAGIPRIDSPWSLGGTVYYSDPYDNLLSGNVTYGNGWSDANGNTENPNSGPIEAGVLGLKTPLGLVFRNSILTSLRFSQNDPVYGEYSDLTGESQECPPGLIVDHVHWADRGLKSGGTDAESGWYRSHVKWDSEGNCTSGAMYFDNWGTRTLSGTGINYLYGIGDHSNDYASSGAMIADLSGTGTIIPGFNHPNSGSVVGVGGGNPNGRPNIGAFSFKLLGGSQVDPTF